MTSDLPNYLFYAVGLVAGLGWLALVLFPRQRWAHLWFAGIIIPTLLGIAYTVVMAVYWNQPPEGRVTGFLSLPGMHSLFQNPGLLLAGYIDLLVMPLIVAAWMARAGTDLGMPYRRLLLCFVLTLAVPGTGFVLFVLMYGMQRGKQLEAASLQV